MVKITHRCLGGRYPVILKYIFLICALYTHTFFQHPQSFAQKKSLVCGRSLTSFAFFVRFLSHHPAILISIPNFFPPHRAWISSVTCHWIADRSTVLTAARRNRRVAPLTGCPDSTLRPPPSTPLPPLCLQMTQMFDNLVHARARAQTICLPALRRGGIRSKSCTRKGENLDTRPQRGNNSNHIPPPKSSKKTNI